LLLFTKMVSIEIPSGIEVNVEQARIIIKGPKGQVARTFHKDINIKKTDNKVEIIAKKKLAKSRALVGTFVSHIKNMFTGVQTPYIYKLKIVSTHFPITVTQQNNEISITNFLGEKKARKASIPAGATVKIQGDIVSVESVDIELAGMTASRIERATRVRLKDRRTFLDGIYIIEKAGEPVTLD